MPREALQTLIERVSPQSRAASHVQLQSPKMKSIFAYERQGRKTARQFSIHYDSGAASRDGPLAQSEMGVESEEATTSKAMKYIPFVKCPDVRCMRYDQSQHTSAMLM